MPEYLAPGVYVEEVSFRPKSIEGVSTSTCAFVGATRRGPISGTPEVVTSFGEFERMYGGLANLSFAAGNDASPNVTNYMAHAVRSFFDNGGRRMYIGRTFIPRTDGGGAVTSDGVAGATIADDGANRARVFARVPGSGGNGILRVFEKRSRATPVTMNTAPQGSLLCVGGTSGSVAQPALVVGGEPPFALNDGDQLSLIVNGDAPQVVVFGAADVQNLNAVTVAEINALIAAADPAIEVYASLPPSTGRLTLTTADVGAAATLQIGDPGAPDARSALGFPTAAAQGQNGAAVLYYEKRGRNWVGGADGSTTLDTTSVTSAEIITINLEAEDADGSVVGYELLGLSTRHPLYLGHVLPETPSRRADSLQNPYYFSVSGTLDVFDLHRGFFGRLSENSFVLTGGNDGAAPTAATDIDDAVSYSDTLEILEEINNISMVAGPGHSALAETVFIAVQQALISHAERMRYRVAVLDTPRGQSISGARDTRSRVDSTYAALYYPWVMVANPLARPGNEQIPSELALPPSGFVAGVYARTDINRGVWKAPANEVVRGALRFEREINHGQQEVLNPEGINCLRFFFGRGNRIWGARTVSSDPEWKYVNVRRYFIYLEHSIDRSTQWAVFEPNGERLWSNITDTVTAFLYNEWRSGALMGATPEEAFFVRCDRSTMTQNDFDNGRLICEIGVAPLKPAEFVIFRIGQKTADAQG